MLDNYVQLNLTHTTYPCVCLLKTQEVVIRFLAKATDSGHAVTGVGRRVIVYQKDAKFRGEESIPSQLNSG